ncbi:hypothetical protein K438DRAFT_1747009 [Mycena galopus ATCC 62051]|nr:hypothetical protein K438DRAFT_1747009 [Mycena galopus ATCC 62051]
MAGVARRRPYGLWDVGERSSRSGNTGLFSAHLSAQSRELMVVFDGIANKLLPDIDRRRRHDLIVAAAAATPGLLVERGLLRFYLRGFCGLHKRIARGGGLKCEVVYWTGAWEVEDVQDRLYG